MFPSALVDYNELMQQMLATNATYLAVSVTIIIFIGGFIYLFNIKPFQEELSKTTKELIALQTKNNQLYKDNESLKNELKASLQTAKRTLQKNIISFENKLGELEDQISSKTDSIKVSTEKSITEFFDEVKKSLKELEEKTADELIATKWKHEWSDSYLWDTRKVPMNSFISLVRAYQISNNSKEKWMLDITVSTIDVWIKSHYESLKNDETFIKYKDILLIEMKSNTNPDAATQDIIKVLS